MKRARITQILVEGNPSLLEKLAMQINEQYPVSVVREPEKSLVMSKVRDSVSGNPFYMGEILITECTISIGETYGFGAIMGEDAERAYQLAIVDGARNAKLPETTGWEKLLLEEEIRIGYQKRLEHSQIMRSKVNFDTMGEYHAKP